MWIKLSIEHITKGEQLSCPSHKLITAKTKKKSAFACQVWIECN